jgi:hypothetical protein
MRAGWVLLYVSALGLGCDDTPTDLLPLAPPKDGVQLVFGPFDVPRASSMVPPGEKPGEVQICRTLKLDNDAPMAVNRLEVALNHGSHHFILFRSKKNFADQIFTCWGTINFDDWEFVVDVNKSGGNDWRLPDGQAFVFDPHQQLMIQAHFVNGSTVATPLGGMAKINLYRTELASVQHVLLGRFTVNSDLDPNIPPGTPFMGKHITRRCTFSEPVYLAAMTGHFHARGDQFDVFQVWDNVQDNVYTEGDILIYRNNAATGGWDSPLFKIFDPPPLTGGLNAGVRFDCYYHNSTDQPISWGGQADVQEHCNLFFQYYVDPVAHRNDPAGMQARPITCTEGSGGW